jgi:hypothetical protein
VKILGCAAAYFFLLFLPQTIELALAVQTQAYPNRLNGYPQEHQKANHPAPKPGHLVKRSNDFKGIIEDFTGPLTSFVASTCLENKLACRQIGIFYFVVVGEHRPIRIQSTNAVLVLHALGISQ